MFLPYQRTTRSPGIAVGRIGWHPILQAVSCYGASLTLIWRDSCRQNQPIRQFAVAEIDARKLPGLPKPNSKTRESRPEVLGIPGYFQCLSHSGTGLAPLRSA